MATRVGGDEKAVELLLTNQAKLIPDPTATVNVEIAKRAFYKEFTTILPLANVSEGGYSISWNMDAVKLWYNALCEELGESNITKPKVKGHSDLW